MILACLFASSKKSEGRVSFSETIEICARFYPEIFLIHFLCFVVRVKHSGFFDRDFSKAEFLQRK